MLGRIFNLLKETFDLQGPEIEKAGRVFFSHMFDATVLCSFHIEDGNVNLKHITDSYESGITSNKNDECF